MTAHELQRALHYHQNGQLDEAELLYRQLLEKEPKNADIYHLLGILTAQKGQLQEAKEYILQALKIEPNSATFYNSLGNIEKNLSHLDSAIENYQRALELAPNSAGTHNNLGIIFAQTDQLSQAITHYKKAIELKPDFADAYYNLSQIYIKQQKHDDAIEQLKKTIQFQADHPQGQTLLGQLLLQKNNPAEAIIHFEQRLKIDPEHTETHHQLAIAFLQTDDWENAESHFKTTLMLDPQHLEAMQNLGALYILRRQPEEALKFYLHLLQKKPDLETYYNLGVIYLYQNKMQEALGYLAEAHKINPQHLPTLINMATIYLKCEDLKNAIHYYQLAAQLEPNNPELNYILSALTENQNVKQVPSMYIENLFDQYAHHFDKHLLEHLNYRVPELIYQLVTSYQNIAEKSIRILDLGCGTGLCGIKFFHLAQYMIGVDLSKEMLIKAREKNIYSDLIQADIQDVLLKYHDIDLIIAGDVLGYLGELSLFFERVHQALTPGGLFAFTIEKSAKNPYQLQKNARFSHHLDYTKELSQKFHFKVIQTEDVTLRTQKKHPVEGYAILIQKPS